MHILCCFQKSPLRVFIHRIDYLNLWNEYIPDYRKKKLQKESYGSHALSPTSASLKSVLDIYELEGSYK